MSYQLDKKYQFIGKIESLNQGDHFSNITVLLEDKTQINIKTDKQQQASLMLGKLYQFEAIGTAKNEDVVLSLLAFQLAEAVLSPKELEKLMPIFYIYAPIDATTLRENILSFLAQISNEVLSKVSYKIFEKYEEKFFMHPAATKFHHAYFGGLAYHTYTMLKLAEGYLAVYPFLNKDLLISGILIHDIAKIEEITGVDGEYTPSGLLLGHLVLGVNDIQDAAQTLGFTQKEEVMLLKHMMISHHGQLNFGSPKKPQTAEALVLWLIDTADAKLTVLGEVLSQTQSGVFTPSVPVLDKQRFYKPKLND